MSAIEKNLFQYLEDSRNVSNHFVLSVKELNKEYAKILVRPESKSGETYDYILFRSPQDSCLVVNDQARPQPLVNPFDDILD